MILINSPSKAPLAGDCCSWVILAELCACVLICGQAAGEPATMALNACEDNASDTTIRQLFQQVKDDFNGTTKQKHQIDGVVISHTTRRTQP
jgi:hypothetical protein